jgi:hypothetical protein
VSGISETVKDMGVGGKAKMTSTIVYPNRFGLISTIEHTGKSEVRKKYIT